MSSISLSLKAVLAASALAGLTLLACGEDAPADTDTEQDEAKADEDEEKDEEKKDAGKKDAGKVDARAQIPMGVPGEECTGIGAVCEGCGAQTCFTQCVDGTYDECKSPAQLIPDGGIKLPPLTTDAGTFSAKDGQVTLQVGDSSVVIPPMECPAPLVCSSKAMGLSTGVISMLAGGAAACVANDAIGLPPACQTNTECMAAGLKLSMCTGGFCLQICK